MRVVDAKPPIGCKYSEDFEQLYRAHARDMYGLALQLTKCEEQARDIVQQVFAGVWERKDFQINTSWRHYLLRATKLECIDHFRKKDRQKTSLFDELTEVGGSEKTTEHQVLANELKARVKELSDQLSPQCRRVFSLSREVGYSNREIALNLQISVRAVEQHITKALSHLRKNLKENHVTTSLFFIFNFLY